MTGRTVLDAAAVQVTVRRVTASLDVRFPPGPLDDRAELPERLDVTVEDAAVAPFPAELVPPPPNPLHTSRLSNARTKSTWF
jgi:hypothetical protein